MNIAKDISVGVDLLPADLVDYIAMDVKASLNFPSYSKSAGIKNPLILEKIKDSIRLIMKSDIDYEFRTTVVPTLHEEEDMEILDSKFKKVKPYSIEKLNQIQKLVSPYGEKCVVRGS